METVMEREKEGAANDKISDGKYIIGFDNGYQFGKSATTMFENGVYPLGKVEPSVREHSLKYDRRYYKVGEGRAAITEDKIYYDNNIADNFSSNNSI
jgi:hypothetical protein